VRIESASAILVLIPQSVGKGSTRQKVVVLIGEVQHIAHVNGGESACGSRRLAGILTEFPVGRRSSVKT